MLRRTSYWQKAPQHDAQTKDLRASLTEVVGPQLFRLSFAYGAAVLIIKGSPSFRRGLAACQPELLRLSRRVGIGVQLLATSSAQHTQARCRPVPACRSCLASSSRQWPAPPPVCGPHNEVAACK